MTRLTLPRPDLAREPAVLLYKGGGIAFGVVVLPLDELIAAAEAWSSVAKAEPGYGEVNSAGERWITVHPHGEDQPGQPVKIRESSTHRGTWHVVGGAGGKLNYLRLTNVKSPEEYKRKAEEKRQQRKEADKAKSEARQQRLSEMSSDERKAHQEAERAKERSQEEARAKLKTEQQQFVSDIAKALGWNAGEWQFDKTREKLEKAGASEKRVEKIEEAHWKRVYQRALDAAEAASRQLLMDHEMRAAAGLGEMPLRSDDPEVVALSDLDPEKVLKGKGYRSDVTERSDTEIIGQLARTDVKRLKSDIEKLQEAMGPELSHDVAGELKQKRAELRVAQLVQDAAGKSPEEIAESQRKLEEEATGVENDQAGYRQDLRDLRSVPTEQRTDGQSQRLQELEERVRQDQKRLDDIRRRQEDLEVLRGSAAPAVEGEKAELSHQWRKEREEQIRAHSGEEGVQAYRQRREMMEAGLARYRAEMEHYKAVGALKKPDLPVDVPTEGKAALEIVQKAKAIRKLERDVQSKVRKDETIDERLFGKGYYTAVSTKQVQKELREKHATEIAEQRTKAFLREVEEREKDPVLAGLSEDEKRASLERHMGTGAYNAANYAALTVLQNANVRRDVVDVLGAAGTAQLLAREIRRTKSGDDLQAVVSGIEDFHLKNHMEESEEALRQASELYEKAKEIELGLAENPSDLARQQEANAKRREALHEARQILGRTLGELETYAALSMALKEKPRDEIHTTLGPISAETAIRQARALGLARDDYSIDFDGTNRFLTVRASGLDKLIEPVDPEELRVAEEVMAIKRGERDEDGWLPPGVVSRPATAFTDPGLEAESFGRHQQMQRPFSSWGTAGTDARADVEDYIGAKMADGEDPNDILPDILSNLSAIPEQSREAVMRTLDDIMPAEVEEGGRRKRVKADYHLDRLQKLAAQHVEKRFGSSGDVAAFHAQSLKTGTPEDARRTTEALHLAVAQDPRVLVAFKAPGEMTHQDQAALRHFFNTEIAKGDAAGAAAIKERLQELGAEPPKESTGLFGAQTNPEWVEWNRQRQAIVAEARDASPEWSDYVAAHGDTRRAYEALQDRLKHAFVDRFRKTYAAAHGEPLRIGKRSIRNAERHLSFVNPEEREKLRAEEARMRDQLRNRIKGKYAAGSVRDKIDRVLQAQEIERQNQIGLFGVGEAAPKKDLEIGEHERLALGERAENQLRALMAGQMPNFQHALDQPIDITPDFRMSGTAKIKGTEVDLTNQQRTVKMFQARKRMGAFLGTGSGKTPIAIASFTAAASDPASGVQRGLFLARSNNLGQFHGEFARFVDPSRFNWYANPSASADERFGAHRDANRHMVAATHESFRDDMMQALEGVAPRNILDKPNGVRDWFMGLTRQQRAAAMKDAWKANGIDYQALFLDEGHVTLDRRGKPDSLLSAVMTAASDNTSHYMAMTADPVKNDISEIRSQLDKIYPDGRYGDEQEWHKRYGIGTTAAQDALRREVGAHFMVQHIQPPVQANRRSEQIPLTPWQQEQYAATMQHFDKLRASRMRGQIDVEAAKALSPSTFENLEQSEHESAARRVADAVGTMKEAALHRIVNQAPPEHSAKLQHLRKMLKDHPTREKPIVIFAHNPSVVEQIGEGLREDGHRVTTLHGGHSTGEKDHRRRQFQPDTGHDPEADVIVLSDAGATGLNLQRGQTLVQYDTPLTAMVHNQRQGRIHRLGQSQDVDLIDLTTDTPFEERARQRIEKKYDLKDIFGTDAVAAFDESDLGAFIARARGQRTQAEASRVARLAA